MKKIGYLVELMLSVIGSIGGICYSLYINEWVIAIAIAVLAYMAVPKIVATFKELAS